MVISWSGLDRHVFIVVSLCAYDCEYEASAASRNLQLGDGGAVLVVSGST